MKILIIHQHYFPEMSGTARRSKELAENFVKKGHNVSILTSIPREYRSLPDERYGLNETINGVLVHRINNFIQVKKNVLLRMMSYFTFVLLSIRIGIKISREVDIIISIAPLSSGIIGSILKIINKKYHHFDIPDILPDLGIAAGMIKNKFVIIILKKLEKWVYNNSDSISTCTKGQMNNIINKKVPSIKISCIPDWIDSSFFYDNLKKYGDHVIRKYNYPNKKIISFVGNIGALQNPKIFIEVMEELKVNNYDQFVFLFIGDGIMRPYLYKEVINKKLENIHFVGRVKREHIPAIMKISDILVTNYVTDSHLDLYIPGKLFEYAISAKPILAGVRGDAKRFIEKYKLGITVNPSSKNEFVNGILDISSGKYIYKPNTTDFAKEYSINNVSSKYDKIFKNLFK